jgi:uncharacterized membrane protein YdjX (TVP38/TMEM64 family)
MVAAVLLLAALWRWTPLRAAADPERLQAWIEPHRTSWLAPLLTVGGFVAGGLLLIPVIALILACGLLFGPVLGPIYAMAGCLASAATGFGLGRRLGFRTFQQLAGRRLRAIERGLARRGILSVVLIRKLPLAPFMIVNIAAGTTQLRFRDFLIGTFLGMIVAVLALTTFAQQVGAAVHEPGATTIAAAVGLLVLLVVVSLVAQKLLDRVAERPA